ncbi:hypothetical protein ATN81_18930 [Agrobacterium pusense]|uniref:hypothetical protein n=1 Tax=Agrobacterium pusense TaxID=648995 RepID=UPI0009290F32|nr:hypothetical protein [Agrobacterium pusense]OJH53465.1 hypothetical protein ATN81_18930 [Agrobacterium pusense]OJH57774.1 hypothetical protein BA725_20835 [Agrobacterium pusense]
MKVWTLAAIVAVSCAASAAGGWAARGLSIQDRPQLVATPRVIEKCEKDITDVMLKRDLEDLNEGTKRVYAIATYECYEYGLVTDRYMDAIKSSQIGPYLEQYKANPNVWRKS